MLGLAPLALGLSEGALLSAALATVVIGGLLTSTLLTLVVIPVIYSLLMGARERVTGDRTPRRDAEDGAPEQPEPVAMGTPVAAAAAATTQPRTGASSTSAPDTTALSPAAGQLATVGRFTSRAEAERARSYLSTAGLQEDRLVVRPGAVGRPRGRTRMARLAADWLRRYQPELLASGPTWELAAPPPVAATARAVLAGNGQVIDERLPIRGRS
jgi:hypothetical protein